MIKVSIIVPVCNVEKELATCLDSLINQTMDEIEIICVDDCSRDGCKEILEQYAKRDNRIINIFHNKNLGTSQARKNAVLSSHGKYIMFVDGDDYLMPDACSIAYNAIEQKNVDIVQFDVNIINRGNFSKERIELNQKLVAPCIEDIEESNLINACWIDKKFGFSLWNKIYNGDLCREAFSYIEDGYFPKAQDLYAFFIIAFWAKSSSGIEDKLYNYNFGIGVTGGTYLSLEKFEILLTEHEVYNAIERFLRKQEVYDQYETVAHIIYQHFLGECVTKWFNSLRPELLWDGFLRLIDVWSFKESLCKLAERNWFNRSKVAEKLVDIPYFKHIKRSPNKKLTIAAYYRSISNGGAQRVVATLCNIWSSLKDDDGQPLYNIILVTDEQPSENEYELNNNIKRAFLPNFETAIKENYKERFEAWENILSTYDIDIVVSGMWVSACTLWDMLCIKGYKTKPAYLLHSHSFCCLPYRFSGETALELTYDYQICDGVVTLSECDRRFVSAFSQYTKCINNPITFSTSLLNVSDISPEKNTLVWVGRISAEKKPLDAVSMMLYVVKEIPDAKLYMVGDGDEELVQQLKDSIEKLGLEKNIVLVGFTQEVEKYYQKANLYISTSENEGFSLTFCEAMSHELPVIAYDMPWLTFMRDGRGIISVKQGRIDLMAREVVKLLNDFEMRKQLGKNGKQQIVEMEKIDIGKEWKDFFDGINTSSNYVQLSPDECTLYKYLSVYQQIGKNSIRYPLQRKLKETYAQKSEINRKLQITYGEKSEINRKLQITYGEKYERGLLIKDLKKQNENLKLQNKKLIEQKKEVEKSTTYRVGKIIMFFPILIKKLVLKIV